MKKLFLAILIAIFGVFIMGCQSGQQSEQTTQTVDPNAITCDGIGLVKLNYTYDDLVQAVGANNLNHGTESVNGTDVQVTRVYEGEAEEIIVYWAESTEPFLTITRLAINNSFGPYQTSEGIRVGSTLDDLRQANNFMPVTMKNFYNSIDGFGEIVGFNGGDIETDYPCLGGVLDIVRQRGVDVAILDEIKPQPELLSSHKVFSVLDVEVVELSVSR